MRTTFTQKFNQQQKVQKQISKKWGYNIKQNSLGTSRISITLTSQKSKSKSKDKQKQICINTKIVPRNTQDIKPAMSQKYKELLKQMSQSQYEKQIRKRTQQKNNQLNIIKMLNERIQEYNYLIDHKHIINKNSEQTKKVLKLKPKSEAQMILEQINRQNHQLLQVQDIEKQFQINKTIATLYRKYKDKMYEEYKQISNQSINYQKLLQKSKNLDTLNTNGSTSKTQTIMSKKNKIQADRIIDQIFRNTQQLTKLTNIQQITLLYRNIKYKFYQESLNLLQYHRRKPKSQAQRIAEQERKIKKMRQPLKIQDMQAIMGLYSRLPQINSSINNSRIGNEYQNALFHLNLEKKIRNQSQHIKLKRNSSLSKQKQQNKKRVKSSAKVDQNLSNINNNHRLQYDEDQKQIQSSNQVDQIKKKNNSLYQKVRIRNTKTSNIVSDTLIDQKNQKELENKKMVGRTKRNRKLNNLKSNEQEQLNIDQPYLNEDEIQMLKQLKSTNIRNKQIIEKYKSKIDENINATLKRSKSKTRRILELMKQQQNPGLIDEVLAQMRQKKKAQQKYFSSYLQKRNRKYKKPWGNKILIKYDSSGQAKQMLSGATATINPNKTQDNFPNQRMKTEQKSIKDPSPKTTSFRFHMKSINGNINTNMLNERSEQDAMIEQSIIEQKNNKEHYDKMCKNQKVNLYLKSKKRNNKQ